MAGASTSVADRAGLSNLDQSIAGSTRVNEGAQVNGRTGRLEPAAISHGGYKNGAGRGCGLRQGTGPGGPCTAPEKGQEIDLLAMLDLALSRPAVSLAVTAKYQVPGSRLSIM